MMLFRTGARIRPARDASRTHAPQCSNSSAMSSLAAAPLAFAARVPGARLDTRRRCVVRPCVRAKFRLATQSAMNVDKSLHEEDRERVVNPVVLATAAVATAVLLAAAPARSADAVPSVDVGAPDYYLRTLDSAGLKPASIPYESSSAPATGLDRFGSAATAADETASLVSTAVALGLAAALGIGGNKRNEGPGGSGGHKSVGRSGPKSNIVKAGKGNNKPFNKTVAGTAYVPSYKGSVSYKASNASFGSNGGGDFRGDSEGSAPAMQAAAALGATMMVGGLAGGAVVLEAEQTAVAAVATGAVLLGTAVTKTRKTTDVKSNIVTFKTDVAPSLTRTREVQTKTSRAAGKKPPSKPFLKTKAQPGAGFSGSAGDALTGTVAALAVMGLAGLLVAGTGTRETSGTASVPSRTEKDALVAAPGKQFQKISHSASIADSNRAPPTLAPTLAPTLDSPSIQAVDLPESAFEAEVPDLFGSRITPPVFFLSLAAAAAAASASASAVSTRAAAVGVFGGSRRTPKPSAFDPAAVAENVADAQTWINAWHRSIVYPENPAHVFRSAWSKNAVSPEKAFEARVYRLEAAAARNPKPFSASAVAFKARDAQLWIDAWERDLKRSKDLEAKRLHIETQASAWAFVNTWRRSLLYPENPTSVFREEWSKNAPSPDALEEARAYAAEAILASRPKPFSEASAWKRTLDAQLWIDAWERDRKVSSQESRASAGPVATAGPVAIATVGTLASAVTLVSPARRKPSSKTAIKKAAAKMVKKQAKRAQKGTGSKKSGRSYYETIAGVKYDRKVLDGCRAFVRNGAVFDAIEAENTWADISDGPKKKQVRPDGRVVKSSVTNVEIATAKYILTAFPWNDDAKSWFESRIENADVAEE